MSSQELLYINCEVLWNFLMFECSNSCATGVNDESEIGVVKSISDVK